MAKKIKNTDYLYLTGYLRAKENALLTKERADRMINAKTVRDSAKILEECGYGDMQDLTMASLGEKLARRRVAIMKDLSFSVPDKTILDIFRIKYDYHNAKVMVKSEAMGTDGKGLLSNAGRYDADEFASAYNKADGSLFSKTLFTAIEEAKDILARTSDPQISDFILDKAYFDEFIQLSKETGSSFLEGYGRLMVDCANLKSTVRSLRMKKNAKFIERVLISGGSISIEAIMKAVSSRESVSAAFSGSALYKTALIGDEAVAGGSVTEFERQCDDILSEYLSGAKMVSFGPEVLTSYLCAVENELSAVRIIISGKLTGVSDETIRARLGSYYK